MPTTSQESNAYTSQTPLQGASSPVRAATPGGANPAALKRKLTLLQLIDELTELRDNTMDLHAIQQAPQNNHTEGTKDTVLLNDDEDLQEREGADAYMLFEKQINALDNGLQAFQNAARQLGSSIGLLSSAFKLRQRLFVVLHLFRENAESLFPKYIKAKPEPVDLPPARKPTKAGGPKAAILRRPTMVVEKDAEDLPREMVALAHDITHFLHHLEEFPEFVDPAVNASITTFQHDLKYRADCLEEFPGQFSTPGVRKYVHDISGEMGHHLETITRALQDFVNVGVPAIRFAQETTGNNMLNLSTIATFFSGVTATTAQYSFDQNNNILEWMTNLLFFGSLVLSISAAINSLLGLTWKHAMYRSPRHRVPWWVMIWIKRSPLVFMVASVALFSAGLVCFCYASQQPVVAIVVLVLTALCTFGLGAVSLWFIAERWAYSRHQGMRWLADVLEDKWERFCRIPGLRHITHGINAAWNATAKAKRSIFSTFRACFSWRPSIQSPISDSESLPTASVHEFDRETRTPSPILLRRNYTFGDVASGVTEKIHAENAAALKEKRNMSSDDMMLNGTPASRAMHARIDSMISAPAPGEIDSPTSPGTPASEVTPTIIGAGNKFRSVAWRLAKANNAAAGSSNGTPAAEAPPKAKPRQETTLFSERKKSKSLSGTAGPKKINTLRPQLKKLEIMHMMDAHSALVRHLQFSPNGRLLATCSWDHTTKLWQIPANMNDPVKEARVLAHPSGFVGQVAWSPDGTLLLTKLTRAIRMWTQDGVLKAKINRHRDVKSVTWLPSNKGFLSVEGSEVIHLDLNGNVVATHLFENMNLHDIVVTPDEQRLLGVGTLTRSPNGLNPRMSKEEKRIVVYNIKERDVENRVPILHEVRDVTLSRNGQMVLISYENEAPPQLWRIDMIRDGEDPGSRTARLAHVRTYRPKGRVDFAGPSYFGGTTKDDLVLVPTKYGEILIWDRESGALLHTLKAKDGGGGDLTGVAWNYASDRFMLASASHDGTVRLWTTPDPRPILEPEPEYLQHEARRQETMTSDDTAAHSGSGRSTPAPYSDEPQSIDAFGSPPDEGAPRQIRPRVDSPLQAEFDTSRPPQPHYFRMPP